MSNLSWSEVEETLVQRTFTRETCDLEDMELGASSPQGNPDRIRFQGQDFPLGPVALAQLCQRLDVPVSFAQRLPNKLSIPLLNGLLRQTWEQDPRCWGGWFEKDRIVSFPNPRKEAPLNAPAALNTLRSAFSNQEVQLGNFQQSDRGFHLEVFVEAENREVFKPGDVVQAGVRFDYSDTGCFVPRLASMVLRLKCSNGLVASEVNPPLLLAETQPEQFMLRLWNGTHEVCGHLSHELNAIQALVDQPVDGPGVIEALGVQHGWGRRVRERVQEAWNREELGSSLYTVINALSWVATHDQELASITRRRLSRATLALIREQSGPGLCPLCRTPLDPGMDGNPEGSFLFPRE